MRYSRRIYVYAIWLLLPTMILAGVTTVLVKMQYITGEISQYIVEIPNEVAWTLLLLFCLIAMTFNERFSDVIARKKNNERIFEFIVVVSIITMTTVMTTPTPDPLVFNCSAIAVILAGFMCGPIVSIPAAAIVSAFMLFFSNCVYTRFSDASNVYVLQLLSEAAIAGLAGRHSPPGKKLAVLAITAMLVLNLSIIYLYPIEFEAIYGYPSDFYLVSFIVLFLLTILSAHVLSFALRLKERNKNELKNKEDLRLAHEIQMQSVPQEFPVSHSMDIHAYMEPAIEVGGDFYDCIQISRNLTLFVVADVSDKGLPASLLMMRTMGSIRASAMTKNDPGIILTTINKELCASNPADQFVSVWAGLYDSDTGKLCYANAGHPTPFIRRANGSFERLAVRKAPIIGVTENVRYRSDLITMNTGDVLFVFTDGVNEAFNSKDETLGYEGVQRLLDSADTCSAKSIIESMKKGIRDHVGDNPMSDDITMLCLCVDRSWYNEITVPGKVEELDNVNSFIETVLSEEGCSMKDIMKMEIVSEEIFVNICDHAYAERDGSVTVYCGYHDGEIKLTFADNADYFNPINKEDIVIDEDVGKWPIGGFGIHMIKNLVTYMDYKNYAGMNIFTVWKKVSAPEIDSDPE